MSDILIGGVSLDSLTDEQLKATKLAAEIILQNRYEDRFRRKVCFNSECESANVVCELWFEDYAIVRCDDCGHEESIVY